MRTSSIVISKVYQKIEFGIVLIFILSLCQFGITQAQNFSTNSERDVTDLPVKNILDDSYAFIETRQICFMDGFCMPVTTITPVLGINGYNFVVQYDKDKVVPTGNITVSNDLLLPFIPNGQNASFITDYSTAINEIDGTISIAIYFNAAGGPDAVFTGMGNVCCIEFVKTISFLPADTALFSFDEIVESYPSAASQYKTGTSANFISFTNNLLHGSLKFWSDYSPIKYDSLNSSAYLITNILGCNQTANSVQPDLSGHFTYNVTNGNTIDIKRDIASTTNVHSVINSQDSYFTALTSIKGTQLIGWTPSVFQMIAMDANRDGLVTAGDATQINQRAVGAINQFNQANSSGIDWSFIANYELANSPQYLISGTFPEDDGSGYSKYRIPIVGVCQPVQILNATSCPIIQDETYIGVLIGDVDGNYKYIAPDGLIKNNDLDPLPQIIIDFTKSTFENGEIRIPVSLKADLLITSFDFEFLLKDSMTDSPMRIESSNDLNYNHNLSGNSFSAAVYSLNALPRENTISIVINSDNPVSFESNDFAEALSLVNGKPAEMLIITNSNAKTLNEISPEIIHIYPNPVSTTLYIDLADAESDIKIYHINGNLLYEKSCSSKQILPIDVSNFSSGIYLLKVYSGKSVLTKKIAIR